MSKEKIITVCLVAFISFIKPFIAFAEFEDVQENVLEVIKPCNIRGYTLTQENCTDNKTGKDFCPEDFTYFKHCACDANIYKFSAINCDGDLLGESCEGKYQECSDSWE